MAVALAALAGVLLSRAAAEPAEGTVSVQVTYNGNPFTYATVTAVAQDGSSEYRGELAPPRDGGFTITAPAGVYRIVVAPYGRGGKPRFNEQDGVTVTAGATTTVNIAMEDGSEEPQGTLSGVVRFSDGKPAAGVGVWGAGRRPQVTNSHGEWSVEDAAFGVAPISLFYDGKVRATRFVAFGPSTTQIAMALPASVRPVQGSPAQNAGLAGTARTDEGLSIYHCPGARDNQLRVPFMGRSASGRARASHTSWKGWPADQCLKMDKGPWHRRHTIVGINGVHNWLLGGFGTDTIIGGDDGDVIWSDYNPTGGPPYQVSYIHGGNGRNVIYANATRNYVWTGTNPKTVVHSHDDYASGVIHCENSAIIVYLSVISERHYKLVGCTHISHFSVGF